MTTGHDRSPPRIGHRAAAPGQRSAEMQVGGLRLPRGPLPPPLPSLAGPPSPAAITLAIGEVARRLPSLPPQPRAIPAQPPSEIPPPRAATPQARPKADTGSRSLLARPWVCGIVGFAAGVVFWHFVGFWSFVSTVVFKQESGLTDRDRKRANGTANAVAAGVDRPSTTLRGGLPITDGGASTCAVLRLDRSTGHTLREPCDPRFRSAATPTKAAERGDFKPGTAPPKPAVAGWATRIEPPTAGAD